jgi:hypothetical protein
MIREKSWEGPSGACLIGGAASGCRRGKAVRVHSGWVKLGRVNLEESGPPRGVFQRDGQGKGV